MQGRKCGAVATPQKGFNKMKITKEAKQAICEEYKDRSKTVGEIAEKFGIGRASVARIAVEMGAEPRKAKAYGKKRNGEAARVCPKCRKTIEIKGAKFCCFCGSDMRSNKELLIERIEHAAPVLLHLPENMRDDMVKLLNDIIGELEGNYKNEEL